MARQFSIAPTAAQGGQLGWISADQLNPRLSQVVANASRANFITRSDNRQRYILALADKRAGGNDPLKNKFDVLTVAFPASVKDKRITEFVDVKNRRRAQGAARN